MSSLVNISEAASLGLHTMALLVNHSERRLTNQEIADRLKASGNHLAKVMQRLVKVGLVSSIRGPQGGYLLKKPPRHVTLLEIYEAIDGPVQETACLSEHPICRGTSCILGQAVESIHRQFRDYLSKTTLAELAQSPGFPAAIAGQDPDT